MPTIDPNFYHQHVNLLNNTTIIKYRGNNRRIPHKWEYLHDDFYTVMRPPLFKVGQVVDFVNDYGVVFENKTITEICHPITMMDLIEGEPCYLFDKWDTPWFPARERNIRGKE